MVRMWSGFNQTETMSVELSRQVSASKLSKSWDFVLAFYGISVVTSSLIMNGMLLGVSYKKRKKLRTLDCLITSLAINDISLAVAVFPLFIYSSISHGWRFGDKGCHYFAFMSFALGVSSMMTLTEIAYVRYSMVCRHSLRRKWKCFPEIWTRTTMLVTFPYLHGLLWATGPLLGWGKYFYSPYGTSCSLFWHLKYLPFLTLACLFCLAIPVIVMVFSYCKIVRRKKLSDRSMAKCSSTVRKRSNLTLRTLSMCLAFVLAWTPYAIMGLLMMVIPVSYFPMPVLVFPSMFAKASITTNPILQAVMSTSFRKEAKHLCDCVKKLVGLRTNSASNVSSNNTSTPSFKSKLKGVMTRVIYTDNSGGYTEGSTSM